MPSNGPEAPRRSLRGLRSWELRLLARASITLTATSVGLRLHGYERTRRTLARLTRARPPAAPGPVMEERVVAAKELVDLATTRLPIVDARCLARSLTLWSLLRSRGIDSEVVIGVRAGGSPLDAHAWLERNGLPVNETEEIVATFAPLRRSGDT